ncbi:hypothetical protein [Pasteuria penetrans]|uniref:hypothetical protein n=1 Tax=Pasteuria penetrans TaxID=86005 RepID=UPI000FA73730|nr:hypothetical protein [Pasteuria penetrans]
MCSADPVYRDNEGEFRQEDGIPPSGWRADSKPPYAAGIKSIGSWWIPGRGRECLSGVDYRDQWEQILINRTENAHLHVSKPWLVSKMMGDSPVMI